MLKITTSGSFDNIEKFLKAMKKGDIYSAMDQYGKLGVDSLNSFTPKDTGKTASSWYYKIIKGRGLYSIEWHNSNLAGRVPIAVLIQYGHATGNGGYVQGIDYINPALKNVFDKIAKALWDEVRNA